MNARTAGLSLIIPQIFAWALLMHGCAGSGLRLDEQAIARADGTFVRNIRVRIAPSQTQDFEALLKRCVAIAEARQLPESHEWLTYRESPGRYWFITFSDTPEGFVYPPTLRGFISHFEKFTDETEAGLLLDSLTLIDHETEMEAITRQKPSWSTVGNMSTATHPKARIMVRTVRPGKEAAFDAALQARTAFLARHGYPLPIEGFVTIAAIPRDMRQTQQQVVFPVDWPSFHATDSFGAFVSSLDAEAREEYARLKAALMETMSRAEFYDSDHAPELRYNTN